MNWSNIFVFIITTLSGYGLGKWISKSLTWIAPKFFIIDPNFLVTWFSKKPTMSSELLGYIIYATTSIVMFTISAKLHQLFKGKRK